MTLLNLLIYFSLVTSICSRHFNGGTLSWAPVDPYDNSTPVVITITQTYFWTYPYVTCATNVPISTSRFAGVNTTLICVVDCSTDGGYSNKTIRTITDCISASSPMGMMISERSTNVTLGSDAHFYLANTGTAWTPLNSPAQGGLEWSIITSIDIRPRPDGFINSSPVVKMISPQYVFANKTTEIRIPVSDANAGDDVRCRWSTYTPGYRRRKRFHSEGDNVLSSRIYSTKVKPDVIESIYTRNKRTHCSGDGGGVTCDRSCGSGCKCTCKSCDSTLCNGSICGLSGGCLPQTLTTTVETVGTLRPTSSYPHRQAIDECGDICHDVSLPNGTSLSNCTVQITPTKADVWYGVAVQVEDFINTTSTTPMSSVPIQFLIYVLPTPTCSLAPIILPLSRCLEVQVGVSITFNISVMNQCNQTLVQLSDLMPTSRISGMTRGNLTASSSNSSISYVQFAWTPQSNQIGFQELCMIAYTDEMVQSDTTCVVFTVKNSSNICVTTTTTSTSTTSTTATTSSTTTTSTTSTSTSTTKTTSSTSTSATSSTTSSTSSSTSSSSTTTTITSSSSTTTSTSITSSTTTTTTTSASTTTSTTSSTTTTTTATFTSSTTITSTTITTKVISSQSSNILLLCLGLGLGLPLLLAIGLVSLCLCCRFASGEFWRNLRRQFWKNEPTRCETCERKLLDPAFDKSKTMNENDSNDYRRQYINDGKNQKRENSFYHYIRRSNTVSPSGALSSPATRTTFLSMSSPSVPSYDGIPHEEIPLRELKNSMLMQAYMRQKAVKDDF